MRIGFRAWDLVSKHEDFRSTRQVFEFMPLAFPGKGAWNLGGTTTATCDKDFSRTHPVPRELCPCGLYHYYALENASGVLRGAVQCWGKICSNGTEGFRSKYGRILGILDPGYECFTPPPPPRPESRMIDILYASAHGDLSKERLGELMKTLASRVALAEPSEEMIARIYRQAQENKEEARKLEAAYKQKASIYARSLEVWAEETKRQFLAFVPFPVFKSEEELVQYASKFGELGPRG